MSQSRAALVFSCLLTVVLAGCQSTPPAPPSSSASTAVSTTTADGGKLPYPPTVAYGQKVELASLVVRGKTTVFDFSSPYCPPCQEIAPLMADLHQRRDDLAVITVNINRPEVKGIDWDSPVAKQFRLNSIPHFVIYGPDGQQQLDGDAARDQVMSWLKS